MGNSGKCHSGGNLQLSTEGGLEIQQVDGIENDILNSISSLCTKRGRKEYGPIEETQELLKEKF